MAEPTLLKTKVGARALPPTRARGGRVYLLKWHSVRPMFTSLHLETYRRIRDSFYGWKLVGISLFMLTLSSLVSFQGVGTFVVSLERQFGWSRTVLSGAFALIRVQGAALGPVEGYLIDKFGPRLMVMVGFIVMGVGFVLFSFVQTPWQFYASFVIIGMGAGLGGWLAMIAAVNNWFIRHRALALSIAMSGTHFAGLLVPILALCIEAFGFEVVSLGTGILLIAIAIPVGRLVRNLPEQYGLSPDGDSSPAEAQTASPARRPGDLETDFTTREALRTRAFWCIAIAHIASAVPIVTLSIHLVPKLTDIGLSLSMAGVVVATYTLVALPFQFLSGFLGDKLPKPPLIFVFLTLQAIALLVIAQAQTLAGAFLFAVLFGIAFGGRMPLLFSIRGEYFGRKSFATIMGMSQLPSNFLMIGAPLFAGYMYDTTQSYFVPFTAFGAFTFMGAVLILFAKKPTRERKGQEGASTPRRA